MALIACPECKAEVSDKAPSCPRCGVPIAVQSELVVTAPAQTMLASPMIRVEFAGVEVGRLGKGQSVTVPVAADGVARFSSGVRSTELAVSAGRVTRVQLVWNRLSGKLVATVAG